MLELIVKTLFCIGPKHRFNKLLGVKFYIQK